MWVLGRHQLKSSPNEHRASGAKKGSQIFHLLLANFCYEGAQNRYNRLKTVLRFPKNLLKVPKISSLAFLDF